ncbi:MAG: RHS repeat-associated core domain-containing protein [Myxococcota bacterium]
MPGSSARPRSPFASHRTEGPMALFTRIALCTTAVLLCAIWPPSSARADNEDNEAFNATGGPNDPNEGTPPPCTNCDPLDPCESPSTENRVSFLNGNERYDRTDLEIPGVFSISFMRAYDGASLYDSPLGYGWSSAYDLRLFRHKDNSVTVRGLCGMRSRFVFTGGAYQPFDEKLSTGPILTELNGTFSLQYRSGTKAVFANTDDGRLSYFENPRGHRLVFTYSATKQPLTGTSPFASNTAQALTVAYQYQLLSVEEALKSGATTWHPTGRKLALTYSPTTSRLTRIDSYDGRYVEYAHDSDGNLTDVWRSVDAANTIHTAYTYTLNGEGGDRHNLKSSTEGDGSQAVVRTYDATVPDRIVSETNGTSLVTIDYHLTITTPTTRTVTTTIVDDAGANPYTTATRYEFNADGIETKVIRALGDATLETMTTTERDPATNAALVERSYRKNGGSTVLTRTILTARDSLGNVTQREVVEPTGGSTVTTYSYDPAGLAANQSFLASEESYATADPTQRFRTEYEFLRPCGNPSCAPAAVTRVRRFIDASTYLDTTFGYGTGPNFELETLTLPDGHQLGVGYYALTTPAANPTTPAEFLAIAQMGRLFEIRHQPGGTPIPELKTTYAYDGAGFIASVTRPVDAVQGDAVTQYARDDLGRVHTLTNALGDLAKATYTGPNGTSPGELLTLLESGATATAPGRRQQLVYDPRGRLLEVQRCTDYAPTCGAWKLYREFGYDSESNRLWAQDFSEDGVGGLVPRRTSLFYDKLGRVNRIEDPTAKATLFEYDERANLTQRTDALSRVTQWSYDGLDRMLQETNAISGLTKLGYDAAGNVVSVTDPMNSTTGYGYDGLSRLISVTQPLGQTVRYEWDARDRLAKKILARMAAEESSEHPEIRYGYETWGPLKDAKHFAKSSDPTPLKTTTYTRNRAGEFLSVTDDSIQATPLYSYTVDKLGRTTQTIAKYIPGGDRTLDYVFDARGDLSPLTLTDGAEVLVHAYSYAPDSSRIATATFPGSATPITITRWPHDGEKLVTYPGGVTREVDYDVRVPVSEIRIKPLGGTPLLEKWAYAYTDVLNVATMTDAASRVTSYGYDDLDRLTSADHPTLPAPQDTLPSVETFSYDGVGNRTMSGYAHDANHRLRESPGHSYDYDDDGNTRVRDPGLAGEATYTWDLDSRLTAYVSGATSATYQQDSFARRLKKTVGATTTWYLWSGDHLLAEYSGSGTRSTRYTPLDGFAPAQMAVPNGGGELIHDVHADRLDTPRVMTDATGSVVWEAAYESYGKAHLSTALSTSLNVRLPGQYFDAESESHDNRFRTYAPDLGRYISADPIGQSDVVNVFQYARNNPLFWLDLFGLDVKYNGFVVNNPKVRDGLQKMDEALPGKDIEVTGGDSEGEVRSSATGEIVPDSKPTTPHAEENGARAVDVKVPGATNEEIRDAAEKGGFPPYNTEQDYDYGHTHVALPKVPSNYIPPEVLAEFCRQNPNAPNCKKSPNDCP